MIRFIVFFLWFIGFYHIINTFFVRKLGLPKIFVSLSKELIWFGFIFMLVVLNFRKFLLFLKKYKFLVLFLLFYTSWGILVSYLNGLSFKQILVGFKYDILPFYILLSAIFVGFLLKNEIEKLKFVFILYKFLFYFLLVNLVIGFLKILCPKLFFMLGYGPLRDFMPQYNPPVYYTSGADGVPRFSGVFGGPNELGFFIVFILPFLWYVGRKFGTLLKILKINNIKGNFKMFLSSTFWLGLFEGIVTLSRAFLVGFIFEFIIIFYKKIEKHLILSLIVLFFGVIGIFLLNKTRPLSTNDHFILFQIGLQKVKENPIGYGLGVSGPSAFYTKKGESLYQIKKSVPENTYLQIAIDTGLIGLFLFLIFILAYFFTFYKNLKGRALLGNIKFMLLIGFIGLLVEGMFLHIFGDSMVVYFVMIILGIFTD